jgi:hypothetical protein|tara:strand:+ start:546 stop:884 length:339 start_codon:yes stop_codon:yes gene_type:complete
MTSEKKTEKFSLVMIETVPLFITSNKEVVEDLRAANKNVRARLMDQVESLEDYDKLPKTTINLSYGINRNYWEWPATEDLRDARRDHELQAAALKKLSKEEVAALERYGLRE